MKKHLSVLVLSVVAPWVWAAPNAPQLTDAQHDAAADAALIAKAQKADAAAQDAAADAALIEKAKAQEAKTQDAAADEALAKKAEEQKQKDCEASKDCVPLELIKVVEGEGEEQTPLPHAARAEAGYVAPETVKNAAVPEGGARQLGDPEAIKNAASNTGLKPKPAVFKPNETLDATATPADRDLKPIKAVEKKTASSPNTNETTRTPPASTGNAAADRERAQATLKDPNLMTRDELACAHGVTSNCRVTDVFGSDRDGGARKHKGVDYGPKTVGVDGDPIYSSINGTVTKVGVGGRGGNSITVCNGPTCTFYAHLVEAPSLIPGQTVKAGEVIGRMGNTGVGSNTHLHYEVRYNGTAIDPMSPQAVQLVSNARGGIAIAHSNVMPTGTYSGGINTNVSYPSSGSPSGGVQIGGVNYAANIQYGNTQIGTPFGMQGMMGQMGGMQIGGGPMGVMGAVAQALPVIILNDEQYAEFQETGELKFTERQNGQLETNCKDQKVTAENAELLRKDCTTPSDMEDTELFVGV